MFKLSSVSNHIYLYYLTAVITKSKNFFIIFFPQLTLSVYATNSFYIVFINLLKFCFAISKGFSDIEYIYRHGCIVNKVENKFGFSLNLYQLDILILPILILAIIDKIVSYYYCFLLKQAHNFYQKHIKQKIAWLDIIILQVANYLSTLKAILA